MAYGSAKPSPSGNQRNRDSHQGPSSKQADEAPQQQRDKDLKGDRPNMDRTNRKHTTSQRLGFRGRNPYFWVGLTVLALGVVAFAYVGVFRARTGHDAAFPDFVLRAPLPVQEVYAYALEHPEVLRYMPCYCGCVSAGHMSNLDCFIDQRLAEGSVKYDPMGSA